MDINNTKDNEDEALYIKIDKNLKDRVISYITESKLSGKKETDSIRKLTEEALDKYMIENPIAVSKDTTTLV